MIERIALHNISINLDCDNSASTYDPQSPQKRRVVVFPVAPISTCVLGSPFIWTESFGMGRLTAKLVPFIWFSNCESE